MKIAIFGLGNTGSIIANNLIVHDFNGRGITQISVADIDQNKLTGNVNDLIDAVKVMGKDINIRRGIWESDIYIITAGTPRKNSRQRHPKETNYQTVKDCVEHCITKKPILVVTNPAQYITKRLKRELGIHTIPVGLILNRARRPRSEAGDPEDIMRIILDNKGYTNFGVAAEVIKLIKAFE